MAAPVVHLSKKNNTLPDVTLTPWQLGFRNQSLKHGYGAPGHAQQPLKDVRPVVPQPRVHVLVCDVLPDPRYVGHRRLYEPNPFISMRRTSMMTSQLVDLCTHLA